MRIARGSAERRAGCQMYALRLNRPFSAEAVPDGVSAALDEAADQTGISAVLADALNG